MKFKCDHQFRKGKNVRVYLKGKQGSAAIKYQQYVCVVCGAEDYRML